MSPRTPHVAGAVLFGMLAFRAGAADPIEADLESRFTKTVRPFLESYCVSCHSGEKPKAQFDLSPYSSVAAVIKDYPHWALVLEKLTDKEMPPEKAKAHPKAEDRQAVIDWIDALRRNEARKNAGDPGIVLARRLSNAEYNYTIRDLTGVDLRPTREFPVDPANPAGFDNSGESLAMSPALLNKYLQAARGVANHMVLKLEGIAFAEHPMLVETDRDKYCVNQIMDFYRRQNADYADYFHAAWQFKHRAALGKPKATLAELAAENRVSPKYLVTVWRTLEETKEEIGPTARLQKMWRELPAPGSRRPVLRSNTAEGGREEADSSAVSASSPQRLPSDAVRAGCVQMRDFVAQLRPKLEPRFMNIAAKGIGATSQPFLMWKNRQYATHRMKYDRNALEVEGETKSAAGQAAQPEPGAENEFGPGATVPVNNKPGDPDLTVPAGQRAEYEAAFARFCAVFPDAFYVAERGRNYLDKTKDRGRFLSAGFHNVMGYFRDDQPLYELLLEGKQQQELDTMWRELDFIAEATVRTHIQHFFGESAEARNFARGSDTNSPDVRPEDKEVISERMIKRITAGYLIRARESSNSLAVKAIEDHFESVNSTIRWVERARIEAEPRHLQALQDFAAKAYRRPLSPAERDDLISYYRMAREKAGLPHEEAMRDSVVYVLMSPDFCYRIDLVGQESSSAPTSPRAAAGETPAVPGKGRPLSDYALASRLSYFLWSSMPDAELLARAEAGDLHQPEVLAAQARRMLKDERIRALALEFGGNWLDFRRFEELNTVDRERFTSFNSELRHAMFEEPVRFMIEVVRENRPVLELLYGKHTFVNPVLAKHYGMPDVAGGPDDWVRIEDADRYGRGGLLPMAAFLTKNAPGLRTSPVKRGYWVVKQVLGEHIPPPPAAVPELPRDEAKMDLPLREALAKHREDPSCASCHARFDSLGLALEGYGPIGEKRSRDLADRPVDARASFPGGVEGEGFDGLRQYVREHRQDDFINGLSRKLLAYALGRSLMLSDDPTIEQMRTKLTRDGYRFDSLIESIVTSPQFRTKRGPDTVAQN